MLYKKETSKKKSIWRTSKLSFEVNDFIIQSYINIPTYFQINIDEKDTKVHIVKADRSIKEYGFVKNCFIFRIFSFLTQLKTRKIKSENSSRNEPKQKIEIPSEFIRHILCLGFDEKDAPRLYENKDDWIGINSGGKLLCVKSGCKFYTKVSSDELFEHCRIEHQWRDYPCREENCNYVAYSSTTLKKHAVFHSNLASTNNEFPCSRKSCKASFRLGSTFCH